MEVKGKIIQKLPPQKGTSKSGKEWFKQQYVLETIENFPKKVFFDFFGERATQYPLEPGDTIVLSFDIESREYNGKWYTDIRGWKAEKVAPETAAQQPNAPVQNPATDFTAGNGQDEIPF